MILLNDGSIKNTYFIGGFILSKYSSSYQKYFKAALAATVAGGAFVTVAPLNSQANEAGPTVFKDLNEKAHYYAPVLNLSARGIVKGYEDGTFKPNKSVTRGQAAKILANTLGLDTVNVKDPGFTDVKKTDQYYGPIAALAEAGIINGYDDKTFKPNNNLKRSQMAKIITLGFGLEETALTDNRFTDVKSTDAYAGYVQAMLTNNVTTGTTATTFEPNALVTRGQIASFVVRSEAAVSVKAPADVTSEVVNITDNTVELANGKTYRLATTVKSLVNPSNLAVLKGANVKVTEQDGQINKISSIEITANGNAESHLVLDGKEAALEGDLKVNGDYVSIKNVIVEGNLEIAGKVKNSFLSDGITVKGKTVITDDSAATANNEGKVYRSIAFAGAQTAAEEATNKPVIAFANATMGTIEVSKKDIVIEATGTTKVQSFVLSSNVHLKAEAGVTIPEVILAEGVTEVVLDAKVDSLTINTAAELTVGGTGEIGSVVLTSKDAKVSLSENVKIEKLILPEGVDAKDVIGNYDAIKGNIGTIEGEKNPEVKPETPTTPPGNGGDEGPETPVGPTGNELLNKNLHAHLGKVNDASGGAVGISLSGNTFNVAIHDRNSTLGSFNNAASSIFESFKDNTVVNSATMSVQIGSSIVPITKSDIDNGLDINTVVQKALDEIGLSESNKLSILEGRSMTMQIEGTVEGKPFNSTYQFQF